MKTIGLDLSLSSTGVALFDDGGKLVSSKTLAWKPPRDQMAVTKTKSGKDGLALTPRLKIERLMWLRDELMEIVAAFEGDAQPRVSVAIEGYAYGKPFAAAALGELGGVIRVMLLDEFKIVPLVLSVGTCRQFVVGSGKVTKQQTQEWLRTKGLKFASDDEGDAYVIGLTAFYVMNADKRQALDLDRLELIDTIDGRAVRKSKSRQQRRESGTPDGRGG